MGEKLLSIVIFFGIIFFVAETKSGQEFNKYFLNLGPVKEFNEEVSQLLGVDIAPEVINCSNQNVQDLVLNLFNQNGNVSSQTLVGVSLNNISETGAEPLFDSCSANVLASNNLNYRIRYSVYPQQNNRFYVRIFLF
jgi:hypothetical protein